MELKWNKKDNDIYRGLVKSGKNFSEIKEIMGDRLLLNTKFISNFSSFLKEEISYSMRNTKYSITFSESQIDNNIQNYHAAFKTSKDNEYIVDFIYIKDVLGTYKDKDCYNISFTISKNHKSNDRYEELTGENEQNEVLSKILYIVDSICKTYKIETLIVGLTKNKVKNDIYLDIIKSMNKEYELGISSINNVLDVYYIKYS